MAAIQNMCVYLILRAHSAGTDDRYSTRYMKLTCQFECHLKLSTTEVARILIVVVGYRE